MRIAAAFSQVILASTAFGLVLLVHVELQALAPTPPLTAPPTLAIKAPKSDPANTPQGTASPAPREPQESRWAVPAIAVPAAPSPSQTIAASPAQGEVPSTAEMPKTQVAVAPIDVSPPAISTDQAAPTIAGLPSPVVDVATTVPVAAAPTAAGSVPIPAATPVGVPAAAAETLPPAPQTPALTEPAAETPVGGTPGLKPAKSLFGAVATPAPLAARAIGSYAKGCLSGAQALPVDGPAWQAMRLSRNRNWGHPKLVALVQRLANDGKSKDGWPGLLVGDLAQPRGGPMLTGHASHQIGLDADIWLTPMPDRRLSNSERETIEATSMLSDDGLTVNRDVWTEGHLNIIKRAASYPEVERIFVHPAIKQVLCYAQAAGDRAWLSKVRAYWGHHYHFHIRMTCPSGSANCTPQPPVHGDDGCGKELDDWLRLMANVKAPPLPLPIPAPVTPPPKPKTPMTLDQLPQECRVVLATGNPQFEADVAQADAAQAAAQTAAQTAAAAKAAKLVGTPVPPLPLKSQSTDKSSASVAKKAPGSVSVEKKPQRNSPIPTYFARTYDTGRSQGQR